jgi:ornithine carbamoyltransferase
MSPKHFLNFQGITKKDFQTIINRGLELKNSSDLKKTLKNKVLGLVFEQPSTRTRVSFEAGIQRLGRNLSLSFW